MSWEGSKSKCEAIYKSSMCGLTWLAIPVECWKSPAKKGAFTTNLGTSKIIGSLESIHFKYHLVI